ncbi:MAG: 2-C-methyl-D-erythritol 4-phosphate cytidylyltransferase [Granulosicoccus sp.]
MPLTVPMVSDQLWIVVPAAGYGERMGGSTPKQYLDIAGQSMLQCTLSRLLSVPDLSGIVVVLAPDDVHWLDVPAGNDPLVHTTQGGQTRADSVVSGLQYVLNQAPDASWVMVHDAARPLVSLSDIQRLFSAVYNSGAVGGLLATPVHDTLKRADEYCCVDTTVNRQSLWQAQTPQMFRAGELLNALERALLPAVDVLQGDTQPMSQGQHDKTLHGHVDDSPADLPVDGQKDKHEAPNTSGHLASSVLTDEASAMERLGHEPLLVEALEPNFKITRPGDLQVAAAIITLSREAL